MAGLPDSHISGTRDRIYFFVTTYHDSSFPKQGSYNNFYSRRHCRHILMASPDNGVGLNQAFTNMQHLFLVTGDWYSNHRSQVGHECPADLYFVTCFIGL